MRGRSGLLVAVRHDTTCIGVIQCWSHASSNMASLKDIYLKTPACVAGDLPSWMSSSIGQETPISIIGDLPSFAEERPTGHGFL